MPKLIKNIKADILDYFTGDLYYVTELSGVVQDSDYINLNGFVAYLQNFKRVDYLVYFQKPLMFGLKNQYNQPTIILEISY
jgi:hypothetical protein